jgi:transcriptional regulator with XRE-family HTH domain
MENSINSRVILLKNHFKLDTKQFVAKANISPTTLWSIEKGGEMKPKTIKQIADSFNVDISWLLTGEGEMLAKDNDSKTDPWKDALVSQIKDENNRLQKELERVWQMVQHLTGGAKPNFLKASEKAYTFKMFPGMEQLKSVSGAMVS